MSFLEMWPQIFIFTLVIVVFICFIKEVMSPDIVAMGGMVLVMFTPGVLKNPAEILQVFSNTAPIVIASMFILSAALERTGVMMELGVWFEKLSRGNEFMTFSLMFIISAVLSSFISNTPIVVVFMPIILLQARKYGFKASKLLIPLSYAAIVGGTCTIIGTSTNVLASEIANTSLGSSGFKPIGMFEIAKLGAIFVVITFVYLATIGRWLLPNRLTLATLFESEVGKEYLSNAIITKDSPLIGKIVSESQLGKMKNLRIIELRRKNKKIKKGLRKLIFEEGDEILFKTHLPEVMELTEGQNVILRSHSKIGLSNVKTQSSILMEGIVGIDSSLVGKSLEKINMQDTYGVMILAIHRRGKNIKDNFKDLTLLFGDTLLVEGPVEGMNKLFSERNFINLSQPTQKPLRKNKAPLALIAIFSFLAFGYFNAFPLSCVAILCVFFVLFTKCIDSTEAYKAVEWKIIFIILGMMGIGKAMILTGAADTIASLLIKIIGESHPMLMLSVIYILAAILTELISNQAVAVMITPIAIQIAIAMEVSPRPFIIAVMFAASASFVTPIGYQTNTYVYGAGGYNFTDFTKVGLPLAIVLWLVATWTIPIFWPF